MKKTKIQRVKTPVAPPIAPYVPPVSLDPLYSMAAQLEAIIQLAETRKIEAVNAALQLCKFSGPSHNDCQKVLIDLWKQAKL